MSSVRLAFRSLRPAMVFTRPMSTTSMRMASAGNAKSHEGREEHRDIKSNKPLNPHITSTNPTIVNDIPSVGTKKPSPELIVSIDPNFVPKDSAPENTERMTGGTWTVAPEGGQNSELDVGEMDGIKFKIEPLRRTGEDANTTRARLLYQSRKRGTLESDLLMSTFADTYLPHMTPAQMAQYDLFLDENDWDIYYWATQEPTPTSMGTAEGAGSGSGPRGASAVAQGTDPKLETDEWQRGQPRSGEWAQTIGTFKPAYRPVPARWKNSEILAMLRRHVISRSASGVHEEQPEVGGEGLSQSVRGTGGGGMAFMPPVFQTDRP